MLPFLPTCPSCQAVVIEKLKAQRALLAAEFEKEKQVSEVAPIGAETAGKRASPLRGCRYPCRQPAMIAHPFRVQAALAEQKAALEAKYKHDIEALKVWPFVPDPPQKHPHLRACTSAPGRSYCAVVAAQQPLRWRLALCG